MPRQRSLRKFLHERLSSPDVSDNRWLVRDHLRENNSDNSAFFAALFYNFPGVLVLA